MIKTKLAFTIFLILSLIIFPYYIVYLQSDFLSSMVPGWNTTIVPDQFFSNLIKFIALLITTICYSKLSKIGVQINIKNLLIHLVLTIPAVFIGRISLYELISSVPSTRENFINSIKIIAVITIGLNLLFFVAQIIFWKFCLKTKRNFVKTKNDNYNLSN